LKFAMKSKRPALAGLFLLLKPVWQVRIINRYFFLNFFLIVLCGLQRFPQVALLTGFPQDSGVSGVSGVSRALRVIAELAESDVSSRAEARLMGRHGAGEEPAGSVWLISTTFAVIG
jgi:hypothetical protein